jgi:site-specific DNA-cytosine methylase
MTILNTTLLPKISISSFIPLVGPWIMAAEGLKDEFDIDQKYIFSYAAFANNQRHIQANFPQHIISYLPDALLPNWDAGDKSSTYDVSAYRAYIKDNGIQPTDLMLAVPPCAGLSMLNTATRSAAAAANKWMYETVKWNIAQGNKVLCLENAPGLVGAEGVKVLRVIKSILAFNGVSGEYKIHCTKTTTLNHNLPQKRDRTFLFMYKSDSFKVFKNIKNEHVRFEDIMTRQAEEIPGTNHVTLIGIERDDGLRFISDNNLWEQLRKEAVPGKIGLKSATDMFIRMYKENPAQFDEYPKIVKHMKHIDKKLAEGLGYWDGNPVVAKGKVNAIIAKNAHRILHPVHNRYVTIREMMDLMGYPESFVLQGGDNVRQNFNHICQSVPVCTAKDHIRWAQALVTDDPRYIARTIVDDGIEVFMQNNMNMDLENELKYIEPKDDAFKPYKEKSKTNKLKSFLG